MGRRRLFCSIVLAIGFLPVMLFWPGGADSVEETVVISFSRQKDESPATRLYRVQRGEWIYLIIKRELAHRDESVPELLEKVRHLNPDIKNLNLIYPGQEIVLPLRKGESRPGEDVLSLSDTPELQKLESESPAPQKYTVRPGDTIANILNRLQGIKYKETWRYLDVLAAANPDVKDFNRIFPGQKLVIPDLSLPVTTPRKDKIETVPVDETPVLVLSGQELRFFLEELARLTGGELIADGTYHIPLPPSGRMDVDCESVPMVIFQGGPTFMVDWTGHIPQLLADSIEEQWPGYRVLSGEAYGDPLVLLKAMSATPGFVYGMETPDGPFVAGTIPELHLRFDHVLVARPGTRLQGARTVGIRIHAEEDDPFSESLRRFMRTHEVEVIELKHNRRLLTTKPSRPFIEPSMILGGGSLNLAFAFFEALGRTVESDVNVSLFTMERDGFNLSVTADLLVDGSAGPLIITSRGFSGQFREILDQDGFGIIDTSGYAGEEELLEALASVAGIPAEKGTFEYPLRPGSGKDVDLLRFSAIRAEGDQGVVYFVKGRFDGDAYRELHERWKVKVVVY